MKLEDMGEVGILVRRRNEIKGYITAAMGRPDTLNVVISGTYMDDDIIALAKPVVVQELSARISFIDRKLQQLGVDVG